MKLEIFAIKDIVIGEVFPQSIVLHRSKAEAIRSFKMGILQSASNPNVHVADLQFFHLGHIDTVTNVIEPLNEFVLTGTQALDEAISEYNAQIANLPKNDKNVSNIEVKDND